MRKNQVSEQIRSTNRRNIRPMAEAMERRELMAIDLFYSSTATTNYPGVQVSETVGVNSSLAESVALVGDVNGDGYQDFLFGNPVSNYATLIFGSNPTDYLSLSNADRATTVQQLSSTSGTVRGIKFTAQNQGTSAFGSAVAAAGDVNGDGLADFLIGAPNALDSSNTAGTNGTGKAYLIFGSSTMTAASSTVDMSLASVNNIKVVTLQNSLQSSKTGSSVASAGNVFQETRPAVSIGARTATLGSFAANGAVYVVPNSVLNSGATTIDLATIGQTNGLSGVVLVGTNSNGQTGGSVGVTDFDNDGISDVIVGSYGSSTATLVYGSSSLLTKNLALNTTSTTKGILLNRVANANTSTTIPGINFTGNLDETGYSVSFGGDFNGDTYYDLLIGSPTYGGSNGIPVNSGRATIFYGTKGASNRYVGSVSLDNIPTKIGAAQFIGEAANSYTGNSVSATGYVNTDKYSEILIGAPGYGSDVGRAYLIPGNPGLYGSLNLLNSETNPYIEAEILTTTGSNGRKVGNGVSGLYKAQTAGSKTVDSDNLADIVIGGPGGNLGGIGYLVEGASIPLVTPISNVIITSIGVDALPSTPQPFRVSATTPATMSIYVLSVANSPAGGSFAPLTDIVASSIVVNGVAYSGASVIATSPADLNGDGLPDAIVQITPRSNLKLSNGSGTLTISGLTTNNSRWQGSASIFVVGGTNPTPGPNPVAGGVAYAQDYNQKYNPPVNGEASVPKARALSKLFWKPLSYNAAYGQYLPNKYFQMRQGIAFGTANPANVQAVINQRRNLNNRVNPINGHKSVFMRGRTYAGMKLKSTSPTIPPLG